MASVFSMNSYLGQRILSLVREGDYSHAGEEESIDLAMEVVKRDPTQRILDAGCGRGGTAEYIRRHGWGQVVGLDIETRSIDAARLHYPDCRFIECDVLDVNTHVDLHFDVICMFNAYYCFRDQNDALAMLLRRARPHTQLIIFDHVDRGGYRDHPLMDAGQPFLPNPLKIDEERQRLVHVGWQAPEVRELNREYVRWYASLVGRIETARDEIIAIAGDHGYAHVVDIYRGLLDLARQGKLGAAILSTIPA